ncbi:hypothetical protein GGS23DRAFT_562782 [Durotheca rogersii]|uniref:uncharacterized protein n=1 Tax=Durotheca rogersii TaxID=419775 RepID=UPI00222101AB|nr:uncharacterized protein GGS23DRAFT_562782 [Durotheca rogersii]KAI5864072.1 hypothetical protein GGS23DRAFT_562782 [Durotheca rogersii]
MFSRSTTFACLVRSSSRLPPAPGPIYRRISTSISRMADDASGPVSASPPVAQSTYKPRYIDIGINLADPIFRGLYHGKQRHPDDLSAVVSRAQQVGCQKLIVTGSDFPSSRHALEIAKEYPGVVYTTAGIHPCSSSIFSTTHKHQDADGHTMPCDPDPSQPVSEDHEPDAEKTASIIEELRRLIEEARSNTTSASPLIALGEIGLDYDRLHYCSRKVQLHSFEAQLDLALSLQPQLPLFLHSRAAHADFIGLLKAKFGPRLERLERGAVVHSFTGTPDEMRDLVELGLYVGTNGCSFKTAENCAVVRDIPLDHIMLETDGPWCEVRPSHEGWKYLVAAAAAADAAAVAPPTATLDANGAELTADGTSDAPKPNPIDDQPLQNRQQRPAKAKGKHNNGQSNSKKKEPEVPERFPTVKKEKWAAGAMVKGRNEPCSIERVGRIVAGVKGVAVEDVCEAAWRNTMRVFRLGE